MRLELIPSRVFTHVYKTKVSSMTGLDSRAFNAIEEALYAEARERGGQGIMPNTPIIIVELEKVELGSSMRSMHNTPSPFAHDWSSVSRRATRTVPGPSLTDMTDDYAGIQTRLESINKLNQQNKLLLLC